jgi:hypothetical protein
MKFPSLIILDEVPNVEKIGDYKTLLVCRLDWSEIDVHKIKKSKEWLSHFLLSNRTTEEDKILHLILDEYDWYSELYPNQFKKILSLLDSFKMPKSYYEEIKHFENLALNEFNRSRPFIHSVRDECLKISTLSVSRYFYLIKDALYIWSKVDSEMLQIIECVSLFRFWKGQTGSNLVPERSLESIYPSNNLKKQSELYDTLKMAFEECLELSVVPLRDEWKLREMIKTRIRDEKIKDILK